MTKFDDPKAQNVVPRYSIANDPDVSVYRPEQPVYGFTYSATTVLPNENRQDYPMWDGLFGYFASALAEVSKVSKIGNDQHNPGQPMHWNRAKSGDHANKIVKHLVDHGKVDTDGLRHTAKVAWRALALLQEELEKEQGAPIARNVKNNDHGT